MGIRFCVAGVVVILTLGVAVPASAEPPGMTAPAPNQPMPPAGFAGAGSLGIAGADSSERNGLFIDASLLFGQEAILAGNLQLGWMFGSHLGVFGSLGGLVGEDLGAGFKAIGMRFSEGSVFAEAQFAWLTPSSDCDSDEPCTSPTAHVAILGAGLEFIHFRHFGMELRGQLITDGRDTVTNLGLGLGMYF
jgi:hypothetical protein